ncbi:MAG: cytochrome c [Solirubrobacterales bacterium]|nr:cytochrome c [Solirubrobacterales bacterium]
MFATAGRPPGRFRMIRPRMTSKHLRIVAAAVSALGATGVIAACGSGHVVDSPKDSAAVNHGAQLFYQRCSGCHTLSAASAEGSATKITDRERVDGPNFDERKESVQTTLYAIRYGGFSGAIMPQNIVTGSDAQAVAEFLAKYSGGGGGKTSEDSAISGAPAG